MRQLNRLAIVLLLLAGCAAPDRSAQMTNIQGGVGQAFGGDVGALIYHGYEAAPEVTAVLHFAAASAAVPAGETAKLKAVAHYLAQHPGARVTITGFADAGGNAHGNMALSRARANAAYDALLAHGLPDGVIVAVIGAGTQAAGTTPPARRVVIEVRNAG